MSQVSPQDPWVQVAEVLRLIRTGAAQTRPELADSTRLGRNVITLRLQAAADLALVRPSGDSRSRGGRAAEVWEFAGDQGLLGVCIQGYESARVVLADLTLRPLSVRAVPWTISADPEQNCELIAATLTELAAEHPEASLWGMGLGMLAPVDSTTGRSTDPVTSVTHGIRWPRDFDVRRWFMQRLKVPTWVESVSNLTAVGAAAAPDAPRDLVFVRLGKGVGSGIISDGHLHRGADWVAGEITHVLVSNDPHRICMCGRVGCLDAFTGEWAIEADARRAVAEGRSPQLAAADPLDVAHVVSAAEAGDVASVEIVLRAADALGIALAGVVTWFNPRRVTIGGNVLAGSQLFTNAMRRTLYARALAASVENLELAAGASDRSEEVLGSLTMVREGLLSADYLAEWGPLGSPANAPALLARTTQT